MIEKKKLKDVDVKNVHCFFSDLRGILQRFTISATEFVEGDAYKTGIGFDGSSIRGFKTIEMRIASERAFLDKEVAERCGDMAAELVPHSPGYAGKLMQVCARLFWAVAGVKEKEAELVPIEKLSKDIEEIKKTLE
jgi:hypothetical protein